MQHILSHRNEVTHRAATEAKFQKQLQKDHNTDSLQTRHGRTSCGVLDS